MSGPLSGRLGLRHRELIAIVGAGGKSTILHRLRAELSAAGSAVVLTTTTKMGRDQAIEPIVRSADPQAVTAALEPGKPIFLVIEEHPHKIIGPAPEDLDRLFEEPAIDFIVAEADGARSRWIKAPAPHEPVIPAATTVVIVVVSIRAIGGIISEVAHRPERVAGLVDVGIDAELSADDVAAVILHPDGGRKSVPVPARLVVAITGVDEENQETANTLTALLEASPRVDRVLRLPSR